MMYIASSLQGQNSKCYLIRSGETYKHRDNDDELHQQVDALTSQPQMGMEHSPTVQQYQCGANVL